MNACIDVSQLTKKYRGREAVGGISFQVEQGKIFAFLGPNGAGKSTTMNMLSTLLLKSGGHIRIAGLDTDRKRPEIRRKIGVVFQDDPLDSDLTVYQNLYYRGGLYCRTKEELERRIKSVTKDLALGPLLPKRYGACSGGQKRLVQIGRALLAQPLLLILDEPTTGLDPLTRRQVWDTLVMLNRQKRLTIFFTTHYMEEAAYADEICMLNHGKILFHQTLDHAAGREALESQLNRVYLQRLSGEND